MKLRDFIDKLTGQRVEIQPNQTQEQAEKERAAAKVKADQDRGVALGIPKILAPVVGGLNRRQRRAYQKRNSKLWRVAKLHDAETREVNE